MALNSQFFSLHFPSDVCYCAQFMWRYDTTRGFVHIPLSLYVSIFKTYLSGKYGCGGKESSDDTPHSGYGELGFN